MKPTWPWTKWLLMVALAAVACAGCSTTDELSNTSSRPWNQPRGFDVGLPGYMDQNR